MMEGFGLESKFKVITSRRIVVKIGSNTILNEEGKFNYCFVQDIARQIKNLRNKGYEFVLVSSGAIGCGNSILGLEKSSEIPLNQLAASIGQKKLMSCYSKTLKEYGIISGEVLVSLDDFSNRTKKKNLGNLFRASYTYNILQVVNENDSVSTEEISFGDNDGLSARIGNLTNSDILILLSNIDGLYENVKTKNRISYVSDLDVVKSHCYEGKSSFGTGGMTSKFEAAKRFSGLTFIANGKKKNILEKILSGKDYGTLFDL